MVRPQKSVKQLINQVGITTSFLLIGLGAILSGLLFYVDSISLLRSEKDRLEQIAPIIARSVLGEILAQNEARVPEILNLQRREHQLSHLEYFGTPPFPPVNCSTPPRLFSKKPVCSLFRWEGPPRPFALLLESDTVTPGLNSYSRIWIALVALVLVGALFGVGLLQILLQKRLVEPLIEIAKNPRAFFEKGATSKVPPAAIEEVRLLRTHLSNFILQRDTERDRARALQKRAAVGDLASKVAHDLRTPLMVLKIMLKEAHFPEPQMNEMALKALQGLDTTLNEILHEHRQSAVSETVHVPSLISRILRSLSLLPEFEGIHFELDLKKCTPHFYSTFILASEIHLEQMLTNLIRNAAEACNKRTHSQVLVWIQTTENHFAVCISDNGKGMTETELSRVLTLGTSLKRENGVGLGLSGARSLTEALGGSFEIQSTPEVGTQVFLRFHRADEPSWFVKTLGFTSTPNQQVWICDDDPLQTRAWIRRLTQKGFEESKLRTFNHLFEIEGAFNKLPTKEVALILDHYFVDSKQTGLDWIENRKDKFLRVILITHAWQETAVQERLVAAGLQVAPKEWADSIPLS